MLLLRLLKQIVILFLISIPLELLGAVLLAIYLPIHFKLVAKDPTRSIKLPAALRWFDNADQYVGRDVSTYLKIFRSGLWNTYCWLAFRNPCNYFGYVVLGFTITSSIQPLQTTGNADVGDGSEPGFFFTEALIDGQKRYEYYWIYKYGTHCIRFRMGHKLGDTSKLMIGQAVEQVMVFQPYHSYTGI